MGVEPITFCVSRGVRPACQADDLPIIVQRTIGFLLLSYSYCQFENARARGYLYIIKALARTYVGVAFVTG